MRRLLLNEEYLLFFLFLALLVNPKTHAQTSIGFSNPDSISYLLNFQLPDWGYQTFSLNTSTASYRRTATNETSTNRLSNSGYYQFNDYELRRNFVDLSLTGAYTNYKERDDFTSDLLVLPTIYIDRSDSETESFQQIGADETERSDDQESGTTFFGFEVDYVGYKYFQDKWYVGYDLAGAVGFNYTSQTINSSDGYEYDATFLQRTILAFPGVSLGYGRIRNVTPILRALRLNERLQQFDYNVENTNQVLDLAQQITKRSQYNNIYDRPDKYFWNDMNQLLGNRLSSLDPFEAFYLEDVFNETLGARFEGYQFGITSEYNYNNQMSRLDDNTNPVVRDISLERSMVETIYGVWYRNLTLEHQLSVSAYKDFLLPLERDSNTEWASITNFEASWLWNITDYSITEVSLTDTYSREHYKDFEDDDLVLENYATLRFTYSRFIENRLQISGNVLFTHYYAHTRRPNIDAEIDVFYISLGVNVTYFFNRNIF